MPFLGPEHDTRKADSLKEEISAQLGLAAAVLMTALKPTCELRWIDREHVTWDGLTGSPSPLQQRWVCALTGKNEWRDVPVVREGEQ
jgi:hypothetical protein